MRTLLFVFFLLVPSLSLAGVSAVLLPGTVQHHYGKPSQESAVSPSKVLEAEEIYSIGMGSDKEMKRAVLVAQSTSTYTNFGGYNSYSYPVVFDTVLSAQEFLINSYMIKPEKGKKYIFYPIATAFDDDKNPLGTLLPTNESKIKGNTIKNRFLLPEGTKYLLIHTDPRFVTFDLESGEGLDTDTISMGLASLGGAVGGLFQGLLLNTQVKRGKVDIAPVGIAEVMSVTGSGD